MNCDSIYKNTSIDITRRFGGSQKMAATLRLKTDIKTYAGILKSDENILYLA